MRGGGGGGGGHGGTVSRSEGEEVLPWAWLALWVIQ